MKRYLFAVVLILLFISGCSELPPGCNKHIFKSNSPALNTGGCYGTSMIKELKITGKPECLEIHADNCHDGLIVLQNFCNESLKIAALIFEPSPYQKAIEYLQVDNATVIIESSGYGKYVPDNEIRFESNATLGNKIIHLSFFRTPHLCNRDGSPYRNN